LTFYLPVKVDFNVFVLLFIAGVSKREGWKRHPFAVCGSCSAGAKDIADSLTLLCKQDID
jgi:hypothetical protein